KLLFDYSKDYEYIKHDLSEHQLYCSSEYKATVDKYTETFRMLKETCKGKDKQRSYCNNFLNSFKREKWYEISTLSCSERVDSATIEGLLEQQKISILHNNEQDEYILTGEQSFEHIISNKTSVSSTSISMVIVPLVIGMTIFSIIMCKFTPVGYWLRKVILGKCKRRRNHIMVKNNIENFSIHKVLDTQKRFNLSYDNAY
ncbi:variable surface protein, partial [Plasmodium gonderi]